MSQHHIIITSDKDYKNGTEECHSTAGTKTEIHLNPGDALIYAGNSVKHWREELRWERYVQFFLHYVLAEGKNHHLQYDGRMAIGQPKLNTSKEYYSHSKMIQTILDVYRD